jgi:hypothetical protein
MFVLTRVVVDEGRIKAADGRANLVWEYTVANDTSCAI